MALHCHYAIKTSTRVKASRVSRVTHTEDMVNLSYKSKWTHFNSG